MGRLEEYELLHILDFNNIRKRMSVILRRNNRILLLCKGADNVIYDRLGANQHELKIRTQEHLNVSILDCLNKLPGSLKMNLLSLRNLLGRDYARLY